MNTTLRMRVRTKECQVSEIWWHCFDYLVQGEEVRVLGTTDGETEDVLPLPEVLDEDAVVLVENDRTKGWVDWSELEPIPSVG